MANTLSISQSAINIRSIILDILAIGFIYMVPTLSHLVGLPVYLIEPMRIMLILAIAHTSKQNAYLLALTLPLFSFVVSAHPSMVKTLLITAELVLNVWLFFFLIKRVSNHFVAMLSSILISKVVYYLVKFLLISLVVLNTDLISTPIYLQVITMTLFSGYIFLIYRRREAGDKVSKA